MSNQPNHDHSSLAPFLLVLPLAVCCGLPAILATGVLAAAAGWLSLNGWWLAALVVVLLAAVLGTRWWVRRRRCAVSVLQPPSVERR